jgi:hypothetical protein
MSTEVDVLKIDKDVAIKSMDGEGLVWLHP